MDKPIKPSILIGSHKQDICSEGEIFLCKSCGRLGHVALQCHYYTSEPNAKSLDNATSQVMELQKQEPMEEDWKRVSFAKTKKKSTRPTTTSINVQAVPV